jgi:hypothetical protein
MNEDRKHEEGFRFGTMVLWGIGVFIIYLLSSGPVTRWFPKAADIIYAPLGLLANNKTFAKVMLAWLHLWGVDD